MKSSNETTRVAKDSRSEELFQEHRQRVYEHTDRLFALLMMLQWVAGLIAATVISPRAWSGPMSQVHIHVWAAVLLGGAITAAPITLALLRPGRVYTRYTIAVAQMLMSALLIHLTGGRIETHFHVFGSLAFLAFYRDWRVLVPATGVIALDHMLRGIFWPESVFGVVNASQWRWIEHAAWVIFEDIFLVNSCRQGAAEMRQIATRRAQLESTNQIIAAKVEEQTAELRDSEALFRSLSVSSPIGVFRTGPDPARWVYANDRCSSILNRDVAKLLAGDWTEVVHADDRETIVETWDRATTAGDDFKAEFRLDGTADPFWIQARASRLDTGEQGYVGTVEDVTARILAERHEASLGRILEESTNEIYLYDADTLRFVQVNRGARDNLGYSSEELALLTPLDLETELDRDSFSELVAPLRSGEKAMLVLESSHRRKDGSTYPVEVRLQMGTMGSSRVFAALISDLTERKEAEKERLRMTAALEHAAEAIVITDVDGTVQYVNTAFERVTGYAKNEVIGNNTRILKSGRHDDEFYRDMWASLMAGEVWTGCFVNKRRDGSLYEEEATISAIRDAAGDIANFVAVKRDVTDQRALEKQLGEAQKLESIGQLAAGIAHEINTPTQYVGDNTRFLKDSFQDLLKPLQDVRALLDASQDTAPKAESLEALRASLEEADVEYLSEEIPRAVEQSLEGIDRVTRIVRAMKEFSHPAEDKTPLDLNRAIGSTITVARNEWKYLADLDTDFDDSLGTVPCVPGDFNQVVLNMVVNAAHAIADVVGDSGERKGTIRIKTEQLDDWAEIRIADSGKGIPEQIRKKIFDPFFTTKEVGKGTGQGLSIAHNIIVQKHGGTIDVESEVGSGTTFIIRLPLVDPDHATEEAGHEAAAEEVPV